MVDVIMASVSATVVHSKVQTAVKLLMIITIQFFTAMANNGLTSYLI